MPSFILYPFEALVVVMFSGVGTKPFLAGIEHFQWFTVMNISLVLPYLSVLNFPLVILLR